MLNKLNELKVQYMKNGERNKLTAIKTVLAEVQNKSIAEKKELTDTQILQIIQTAIKQLDETLSFAYKRNDIDIILYYKEQLDLLKTLLPVQMTEEEIKDLILKTIEEKQFKNGVKDLGKLIKTLMPLTQGKADNTLVSKIAKEELLK